MADQFCSTKTISTVNNGNVTIIATPDMNQDGTTFPETYAGILVETPNPIMVNGVNAKTGELLILNDKPLDTSSINSLGELTIDLQDDDVDLYSIDMNTSGNEGELNYDLQSTPGGDTILYAEDTMLVTVVPKLHGKLHIFDYSIDFNLGLFKSEYRYKTLDIFYSEWKDIDTINFTEIVEKDFFIEIRITRIDNGSSPAIFQQVWMVGDFEGYNLIAPTIADSIFYDFINSDLFFQMDRNLFKKLYFRGIIPEYITRAENLSKQEDTDYISLFSTYSFFYCMFIAFFKRYENFNNDYGLLFQWVKQVGLFFNERNISLEDLQYLTQYFWDETRRRGTEMIFNKQGNELPDGTVIPIDGEFNRLYRNGMNDELLHEIVDIDKSGWCLGNSSPMYRGTAWAYNLNKTKENSKNFQNLENFIYTVTDGICEISDWTPQPNDPESINSVLNIGRHGDGIGSVPPPKNGLGRYDNEDFNEDLLYVCDSNMDYEITFLVKLSEVSTPFDPPNPTLLFGVEAFNVNKEKINGAFVTPRFNNISDTFIFQPMPTLGNNWYLVRGIIYAYSSVRITNEKTNLGIGNNLVFNNRFIKYFLPKIQVVGDGTLNIWNYKIRPLVRGTNILPLMNGTENNHSMCFIETSRLLYVYVRNNNPDMTDNELKELSEKYLFPFNISSIITTIK